MILERLATTTMTTIAWTTAAVLLTGGADRDWLHFRGPDHNGTMDAKLPRKWSPDSNISWKAPLPGRGASGPIVVGDRVFLTASSAGFRDDKLMTLCFDAKTGRQLWERSIRATGRVSCHPKISMATPTPASDGKTVVAFYSCNDAAAYSLDGDLLWTRGLNYDYPNASNSVGMSSSPIVVDGVAIFMVENQADSFSIGLDVMTGETKWKLERPAESNWNSPIAYKDKSGKTLVLLPSVGKISAIDPATGESAWDFPKKSHPIASPAANDDYLFVAVWREGLLAIDKNVRSLAPEVKWTSMPSSPNTPSPVVMGDKIITVVGPGLLTATNVADGKVVWKERLKKGPFSGTPVVAGGLIYLFNEDGVGYVVKPGEKGAETIASNELKETILCTPAIAGNALYVRSDKHLWKIADASRTPEAVR
jgi:outer membrane protein assembly factor BamB